MALKRLLKKRTGPSAVIILGRSTHAVCRKAVRLGLWIPRGDWRLPWPTDAVRQLRHLVARGCGPEQIAARGLLNGFSPTAIEKKLRRLGLNNPERRHRRRRTTRLTNRQRASFHAFLHAHVHEWTPEQLALEWSRRFRPKVSHRKAVYHLIVLGIKRPRNVVVRMAYSREKMRRSRMSSLAVREAQARRWNGYRLRLVAQLREQARELTRARAYGTTPPTTKRCSDCGLHWPSRAPFFHVQKKARADGRVWRRVFPRCRLCENSRRRESRRAREPGATIASATA